jgi:hypothetical protein
MWTEDGKVLTAVIGGSTFRIVCYPEESPLAGKFGIYKDGRYQAALSTLAAAKTRCSGLAVKNRRSFNLARAGK